MAPEPQVEAGPGICSIHAHSPSVAVCAECGRALCVTCAVPVRGRVFGTECLESQLGGGPILQPPADEPRRFALPATGIGAAIAVIATLLPWKDFGEGAGAFGAWGLDPRWSWLAAIASVACLVVWGYAAVGRTGPGPRWILSLRVLSALVVAGAVLHLLRPPPFGPSSFGPWVELAAGAVAFAGTWTAEARSLNSRRSVPSA